MKICYNVTFSCTFLQSIARDPQPLSDSQRAWLRASALDLFGSIHLWDALEDAYSEPHRHYHTLAHLHKMFEALQACKQQVRHPDAMRAAIWFHDFVYKVGPDYPENEAQSAQAMCNLLANHAPSLCRQGASEGSQVRLAAEFNMASKAHAVD